MKIRDLREMKNIKIRKFEEFLNESFTDPVLSQVVQRFYMLVQKKYPIGTNPLSTMIHDVRDQLFDQLELDPSNYYSLPIQSGVPILNFTEDNNLIRLMMDKGMISRECLYNHPDASDLVSDKITFHKTFLGANHIPITAFALEDACSLTFPLIAKPAKGKSAEGIVKFDSAEDLRSSVDKFDVFSEMVDIQREYRCFCFRDNIMELNERVKVEGAEDFLKNSETTTDFYYQDVDISSYSKGSLLMDLLRMCREKVRLDFFSIDFAEDSNGDLWIIEMNSRTGMGADKMATLYQKIYEDFYGEMDETTAYALGCIINAWRIEYEKEKGSSVNECTTVAGYLNDSLYLFKNRDRSYTPDTKIVRTKDNGVEIVYYTDQTGWIEGMNEHGVGFVVSQLTTREWKGYSSSYTVTDEPKSIGKFKKFSEGIMKALSAKTAEEAIKRIIDSKKSGSFLVGDKENAFELEVFNGESKQRKLFDLKNPKDFYVKSNHGELFPEAGHQPSGESIKRASSSIRRHQAMTHLQGVRDLEEIPMRMKFQAFDSNSSLNVFRTDDEEHTISQCLMDLSNLKFIFCHDENTADTLSVEEKNFKNPRIKIEIKKYVK
jgi:hypothetical protein